MFAIILHLLVTFYLRCAHIILCTFSGLGYGLAFAPCATIISFYFEKRRALANGITASASGMGAIVLPFLYR